RWMAGGSGAGVSTVARRRAGRDGVRVDATDDAMADHAGRRTPADGPLLARFMAMDMDERWVTRSAETMLETFPWFRGEGFDSILDDIGTLPKRPPVIAEGFRLLPPLVQPLLAVASHAVW